MRSIKWALALAAAAITVLTFNAASAQGTLRIGMTASDIPLTTGQTDQGGEGMRFMGYTVYDGLINWDLSSFDKPSDLVPGLATSYGVDPADASKNKWIFKIREGVKFHDGSEFTADTAVWNFDKLLKNDSPQFDQRQSAQGRSRIPSVASYKAVDKYTLEIVTKSPDASLPYQLAWIMMSSPAQWEKLGKSWEAFAKTPSGTGPWKLTLFAPRERAEMVPNKEYWDKARIPKLDKLVLLPLPEPNARVAALRAGQVDWIEAPAARRGRIAEVGRLQDHHQCLSAQLDVASLARRRLALERHPGTQGRQSGDRPRRHAGASLRPDDSGGGLHAARPSMVRQADLQTQI